MRRPDLTNADPALREYIHFLEKKLGMFPEAENEPLDANRLVETLPSEPPTTISIITLSSSGEAKRTLRHLYARQHRGGMGVFDIDVDPPDYPAVLASMEENQTLLCFTNKARVFRLNLRNLEQSPVRAKGSQVLDRLGLDTGESIVTILPEQAHGYIAIVSETGKARSLRHHLFGEAMRPGTSFFNLNEFGPLAAACWTSGDGELFIITEAGIGIRFSEKSIPPQGALGIRVADDDKVVGIASVNSESEVFILGADGKGTIRVMSGFAGNKTPGGSGKIAFKNPHVIGVLSVTPNDELMIISKLGKMIRFKADEVPVTDGVVQGVICMSLRSDEVCSVLPCSPVFPY
jgi:DNA gyrase subunit A